MDFTRILGYLNLAISLAVLVMLVHHLAHYVDRATTPLRTRLYVWALAVYFLFQMVGSGLYLVGVPPILYFQDSMLIQMLCNYRPSQAHIGLTTVGLCLTMWLHELALQHHKR